MKPICVKCHRFYRPKKNGIAFIEAMPKVQGAMAGTAEPDKWKPYKLWRGDLWHCLGCGHEIISGVGQGPMAEHYQPEFAELSGVAEFQVNDC